MLKSSTRRCIVLFLKNRVVVRSTVCLLGWNSNNKQVVIFWWIKDVTWWFRLTEKLFQNDLKIWTRYLLVSGIEKLRSSRKRFEKLRNDIMKIAFKNKICYIYKSDVLYCRKARQRSFHFSSELKNELTVTRESHCAITLGILSI